MDHEAGGCPEQRGQAVFAAIWSAVQDMAPGRSRLIAAALAYLDLCLQHRGVRALLLEARAEPAIAEAIAERNKQAGRFHSTDFAALGWEKPAMAAALWNGLVVEAALLELAAGRHQPAVRKALAHFLPPQ